MNEQVVVWILSRKSAAFILELRGPTSLDSHRETRGGKSSMGRKEKKKNTVGLNERKRGVFRETGGNESRPLMRELEANL
jgi:hypothetical protein